MSYRSRQVIDGFISQIKAGKTIEEKSLLAGLYEIQADVSGDDRDAERRVSEAKASAAEAVGRAKEIEAQDYRRRWTIVGLCVINIGLIATIVYMALHGVRS